MVEQPPEGPTWSDLADRAGLAAVLDPADVDGTKNSLIDRAHKRALTRALGPVGGLRVLDFGCGNGRLSIWLAELGADVVGIDATVEMIESARREAPALPFHVFDGRRVPVDAGTIDVVLSVFVLQYYVSEADAYASLLRELRRVLKPSGRLIMVEQVTSGVLGRGGTEVQYRQGLRAAAFDIDAARPVRAGSSRIVPLVQRWPILGGLPFLDGLMALEARVAGREEPRGPAYVDFLFAASRENAVRPAR
jgi:SAM-dependent methyltransferase